MHGPSTLLRVQELELGNSERKLPGFVKTETGSLPSDVRDQLEDAASIRFVGRNLGLGRLSAYKTLFSISVLLLVAEVALLAYVVIR